MAEEGKFSRAISKSGAGEKLLPAGEALTPRPEPVVTAPASPATKTGIRRVSGRCTAPASGAVMVHDMGSAIASEFRALRANLFALNGGKPPRVITVTSGTRSEGKTTVAYNLAVALSEVATGRVVAVDGDMHRPCLHTIAGVQAETGLNEILEEGLDLNDHVYETAVPNLDVIPSQSAAPTERSESKLHNGCRQLIAELRRNYAFVVIDTPPMLVGSQASVFGSHSDGVLIVARLEKTPRQVVKRAEEELVKAGAKVIGCVLTHYRYHIPDFIYRFFGSTPAHYYHYRQ